MQLWRVDNHLEKAKLILVAINPALNVYLLLLDFCELLLLFGDEVIESHRTVCGSLAVSQIWI